MNISRHYSSPVRYLTGGLVAAVALWGTLHGLADHDKKDVAFLKEALKGAQAEVEMGKLAAEKGHNPQIKQLGERLQQDHSKAYQELMQLADKCGITWTAEDSHKHVSKLENKSGAAFDKAFAEHALADHQKDIRKYQKALQEVKDPELKAYIQKSLPLLKEHFAMAKNAASAVGVDPKTLSSVEGEGKLDEGVGTAPKSETGRGSDADPNASKSSEDPDK